MSGISTFMTENYFSLDNDLLHVCLKVVWHICKHSRNHHLIYLSLFKNTHIKKKKKIRMSLLQLLFNPFSIRPRQNVVWYNNSWLGFQKKSELCTKRKKEKNLQKLSPHLSQLF